MTRSNGRTAQAAELVAFAIGVFILAAFGVTEVIEHVKESTTCLVVSHPFPIGQILIGSLLIAPKMIGRRTAGQAWVKLAGLARKGDSSDGESDVAGEGSPREGEHPTGE